MLKKLFVKSISFILLICIISSSFFVINAFAAPVEIFDTDPVPVNKNANQTCKNFYQYLWNVRKSGEIISGAVSNKVIGINGTLADGENDYHQYIKNIFGVTPVIMGNHLDLTTLSDEDIQVLAERYKKGAIPMFQLEPGDWSTLTDRKNGIVHYDETNPDRDPAIYEAYVSERKLIGEYCKKLEEAGIEVYIIRLYIENNNSSKQGFYGINYIGYESFKRVWKNTVEYLINEAGVTGALFAYSPAGFNPSEEYYPGADYVDINSPTVYANSSDGEIFKDTDCNDYDWMRYENRPFAFSELAARSVLQPGSTRPIGDYADTLNSLLYAYPELSFFVLWYENVYSIEPSMGSSTIGNYNGEYFIKNPKVINAENALDYRSTKKLNGNGIATFYWSNKESIHLNFGNYSSEQLKSQGIKLSEIESLDVLFGCGVALYESSDCTGEAKMFFGRSDELREIISNAKSISIIKLDNVALEKSIWSDNDDKNVFKINNGKNDKYIIETKNTDGTMDITIDLGAQYVVGQVSLNHAGFYEDTIYNLRDFAVYVSDDDETYKMVYKTVANLLTSSNVYFDAVNARYVKLHIITPNNSSSIVEKQRVSIPEFMIYGTDKIALAISETENDNSQNLGDKENQETVGNLSNGYGDNMLGNDGSDNSNEKNISANSDAEKQEKPPVLPKYEIPEIYNYVWIMFCGVLVVLIGAFWGVIFILLKRKKLRKEKN